MAFLQNNKVIFTILLFGVGIFSSLNIIVLDEEALVLLCFVLFLIFLTQNISEVVRSELQSRSEKIREEFEETNLLQEDMYETLLGYYQKQLSLETEIQSLLLWSKNEVSSLIKTRRAALQNLLQKEVDAKLKNISAKEQSFLLSMQEEISNFLASKVLEKASLLDDEIIEEGILMLESIPSIESSEDDDEYHQYDDE